MNTKTAGIILSFATAVAIAAPQALENTLATRGSVLYTTKSGVTVGLDDPDAPDTPPAEDDTSTGPPEKMKRSVLYTNKNGVTVGIDDDPDAVYEGEPASNAKRTVLLTTRSGVTIGKLSKDEIENNGPALSTRQVDEWNDPVPPTEVNDDDPDVASLWDGKVKRDSKFSIVAKRDKITGCGARSGWMLIYQDQLSGNDKMGYEFAA